MPAPNDLIQSIADALASAGRRGRLRRIPDGHYVQLGIMVHDRAGKVTIDENGYVEIHYWNPREATPAQIANTLESALAALEADPPPQPPMPGRPERSSS